MGDLLTFTPRPKPATPPAPEPLSDLDLRTRIEEAAEIAVDAAQRLIALLDHMDGCPDLEDSADAEPSLAAPENHHGTQIGWCRGGDTDREAEAPETALPEVSVSPVPKLRPAARAQAEQPRQSSFVAAAAVALFDLMERA